MNIFCAAAIVAMSLSGPAFAAMDEVETADGILNPEEMTLNYFANHYDFKNGKSTACMYGYAATKSGDHVNGNKIFDKCVQSGVDAAYAWKSYMYENGYGVEQNFETATDWSKRSADRGYKVGEYNYGLSLLRGLGTPKDIEAGKEWINKSAAKGFLDAQKLIDADYDTDVAIPDADERRVW